MATESPKFQYRFEKQPGLWWILAVFIGLNLWFDYYHPLWFFFDLVIAIILIVKWPRSPNKPPDTLQSYN